MLLNQIKPQACERSLAEGKGHNFSIAVPGHLAAKEQAIAIAQPAARMSRLDGADRGFRADQMRAKEQSLGLFRIVTRPVTPKIALWRRDVMSPIESGRDNKKP